MASRFGFGSWKALAWLMALWWCVYVWQVLPQNLPYPIMYLVRDAAGVDYYQISPPIAAIGLRWGCLAAKADNFSASGGRP